MNRPGFLGGWSARKLRHHRGGLKRGVEGVLCLGRREIADRLEQSAGIVSIHPLERGVLDGFE